MSDDHRRAQEASLCAVLCVCRNVPHHASCSLCLCESPGPVVNILFTAHSAARNPGSPLWSPLHRSHEGRTAAGEGTRQLAAAEWLDGHSALHADASGAAEGEACLAATAAAAARDAMRQLFIGAAALLVVATEALWSPQCGILVCHNSCEAPQYSFVPVRCTAGNTADLTAHYPSS